MVFRFFKAQSRFHARTQTSHLKSTLVAIGANYKIADNIFMFLRVALTHLERWLAFFTKMPRDYICPQTNIIHQVRGTR